MLANGKWAIEEKKWPSTGIKETYILTLIQSIFIQRINIWVSGSIMSARDSFKSNIVLAFKKLIPIMWGRHIIKIISHKWWSYDEKPSRVRGLRGVLSTLLEGDQWRVSEGLVIEINLEESDRTRLEISGEGCFQKQDQVCAKALRQEYTWLTWRTNKEVRVVRED